MQDAAALREMLSVSTKPGVPPLTEQMLKCALVLMPINDKSDPDAHVGKRACLHTHAHARAHLSSPKCLWQAAAIGPC